MYFKSKSSKECRGQEIQKSNINHLKIEVSFYIYARKVKILKRLHPCNKMTRLHLLFVVRLGLFCTLLLWNGIFKRSKEKPNLGTGRYRGRYRAVPAAKEPICCTVQYRPQLPQSWMDDNCSPDSVGRNCSSPSSFISNHPIAIIDSLAGLFDSWLSKVGKSWHWLGISIWLSLFGLLGLFVSIRNNSQLFGWDLTGWPSSASLNLTHKLALFF